MARVERIAKVVLFSLGLAMFITLASAQQGSTASGRLGGDFPAFYGAARIVADGDTANLYDLDTQTAAQADLWGPDDPGTLYFAYPVPVALAYSPFAAFSYPVAYALHTLLMALFVGGSLLLARPMLPGLGRKWWMTVATVASFFPLFRAVTAGQNTALTLLLIVGTWRLVHEDRDFAAGLVLGLLAYKPQFALPLAGLLFLSGRWKVVAGAGLSVTGLWAIGATWAGPGWLLPWWRQVIPFAEVDAQVNAHNSVSAPGFAEALGGGLWAVLGWLIAGVVVVTVSWIWWRRADLRLADRMAVAAPALLLMSPHAMFYDSALVAISLGVLVASGPIQRIRAGALVWLAGLAHMGATAMGWTPLFFMVAGVWLWSVFALVRANPRWVGPRPVGIASVAAQLDNPEDAAPLVSVIVPAYNEAERIGPTLLDMSAYLMDSPLRAEVIIIDDGSADNTVEVAASYGDSFEQLRILRLHHNQGKGAAVRAGMLTATGDLRLLMDADNATALDQLDVLLAAAPSAPEASIAVGSISAGFTDVRQRQPLLRRLLGRGGNLASQALVIPGVRDTQRGFKLFTADAAEAAFGPMQSSRWLFDVEALARARYQGHRILEVPITWAHIDGGQIRADSYVSSLQELARIAQRINSERLGLVEPVVAEVKGEMVTVSNPPVVDWPDDAIKPGVGPAAVTEDGGAEFFEKAE